MATSILRRRTLIPCKQRSLSEYRKDGSPPSPFPKLCQGQCLRGSRRRNNMPVTAVATPYRLSTHSLRNHHVWRASRCANRLCTTRQIFTRLSGRPPMHIMAGMVLTLPTWPILLTCSLRRSRLQISV